MEMANWLWPQIFLAAWMFCGITLPIVVRLVIKTKPFVEWLGFILYKFTTYAALVFILAQVGFWK